MTDHHKGVNAQASSQLRKTEGFRVPHRVRCTFDQIPSQPNFSLHPILLPFLPLGLIPRVLLINFLNTKLPECKSPSESASQRTEVLDISKYWTLIQYFQTAIWQHTSRTLKYSYFWDAIGWKGHELWSTALLYESFETWVLLSSIKKMGLPWLAWLQG